MGTLIYGNESYAVPDEDLTGLQIVMWGAFVRDQRLGIELKSDTRVVSMFLTPYVPITFVIDNPEPMHGGTDDWEAIAKRGGFIEIWVG